MPSSSPYPEHVFIGYLLRARPKDGRLTHSLFYEKETSFAKVTKKVEAQLTSRRVPRPGVVEIYLQKTPHDLIAANNLDAFFDGRSPKDVRIGKIVTSSNGVSQFIPEPKKATKPRTQTTKNFLGECLVNDKYQVPLVIPATGYMKARERVLRLAAAIHDAQPTWTLLFSIRRSQLVEDGQRPQDLLRVPWLSESLVRILCKKGESPSITFPNQFNTKYRPNQGRVDRSIFRIAKLDLVISQLKSQVVPAIVKAQSGAKKSS